MRNPSINDEGSTIRTTFRHCTGMEKLRNHRFLTSPTNAASDAFASPKSMLVFGL